MPNEYHTEKVVCLSFMEFRRTPDIGYRPDDRPVMIQFHLDHHRMSVHSRSKMIDHRKMRLPVYGRHTKQVIEIKLTPEENAALQKSAASVRELVTILGVA